MGEGCDHLDGSPIGKCAVCGKTVCSECYSTLFNVMICDEHEGLDDESEWEVVGYYSDESIAADKRFLLEDNDIRSLAIEGEDDMIEVYVPVDSKDDAFAALQSANDEARSCGECKVEYSSEIDACPLCGEMSPDVDGADLQEEIE
jgi:hypothetical protein